MPISTTPEKLQQTSDELGTEAKDSLIALLSKENIQIKQINFVVQQTDNSASNSFLLGHATNGILGTATALGGGSLVLGSTSGSVTVELIRRRYDWNTENDFEKGSKSRSVDTSQGFLQLGNVTIKDISLEHKENKNN